MDLKIIWKRVGINLSEQLTITQSLIHSFPQWAWGENQKLESEKTQRKNCMCKKSKAK